MEFAVKSFTRHRWTFILVIVALIGVGIRAGAQQPAGTTENSQTPTPFPSAAEPVSKPATNTSEPASGSQTNSAAPTSGISTKESVDESLITLGPGDLVDMNVYNVPELSTKARVSNSGDLYLPLIDYVHVGGLTQEEAQTVIEKRFDEGGFVRNPHVTLFVDEANSQGVTVLGEVSKPGIYPDPVNRKLYDVVSEAGGFTSSASRKVSIIRQNQQIPIQVSLPRNLGDDTSGNVDILPGDTVTVPRAPIIYVVGDVGKPSGFIVDNGALTVLQALALAGGANHTAKLGDTRVIHKTPTGMTETKVQLKKMLEAKAPDVTLQADDILFIPVSGLRVAAARTAEAAVSAATAISVYTVHP
jgi:polysaccharide export outer membrane protein